MLDALGVVLQSSKQSSWSAFMITMSHSPASISKPWSADQMSKMFMGGERKSVASKLVNKLT